MDSKEIRTGFHSLDKETHVRLSRRGGINSHDPRKPKHKRAHEFSSALASAAAKKRWATRSDKRDKE